MSHETLSRAYKLLDKQWQSCGIWSTQDHICCPWVNGIAASASCGRSSVSRPPKAVISGSSSRASSM